MKKVVVSVIKWVSVLSGMLGVSEHIQPEQTALVDRIVADHERLGDLAALDQSCQTDQLAELALKVELIALVGNQIDVALASVKYA